MNMAQIGAPEASITEERKSIAMRDGFESELKIHRPTQTPAAGSPLIVFIFGGGWISGDNDAGTALARAWIRLFGAVVVNISYRLAPEHKYPTGQYDALDSVKWIADHASEIHADPSKGFIIGGISAGGQLTAMVTAQSLKNKLAHPITGQWLGVPSLMNRDNVPAKYKDHFLSLDHNQNVPILPAQALVDLKGLCEWDDKSELRWPILSDPSGTPPTFLQADGLDPLRDDALIYEEVLKDAGVKTRLNFYPGCPHAHFSLMPGIEITNRAIADNMTGIGWLLGKEITPEQGLGALAPAS